MGADLRFARSPRTRPDFPPRCVARLAPILGVLLFALPGLAAAADGETSELPVHRELGGDFVLTTAGRRVQLEDFRGKLVVLSFGYTHCPDVCPFTLGLLRDLVNGLAEQADQVQVLFVSFDPERDGAEHLAAYVEHFHSDFIGLTGTDEEIAAAAQRYRVQYARTRSDSAAGVLFGHTDDLFLIDREGFVRAVYRSSTPIGRMAAEIRQLIAAN